MEIVNQSNDNLEVIALIQHVEELLLNEDKQDHLSALLILSDLLCSLQPQRILPTFSADIIDAKTFKKFFRFSRPQIQLIIRTLEIPDPFVLPNRVKIEVEFAMLVFLRRLSYPGRLSELASYFGREETTLSRTFTSM